MVKAGRMSLVADASIFDEERPIDILLVAGTPDYAQTYSSEDLNTAPVQISASVLIMR